MDEGRARARRGVQLSWAIGGGLLIASAVAGVMALSGGASTAPAATARALLFGAATVVLAVGIPDGRRVAGASRVGAAALIVFGCWPVAAIAVGWMFGGDSDPTPWTVLSYIDLVVSLASGILAVVLIGRGGAVPQAWRWAPLWGLVVVVVPQVLLQLVAVTMQDAAVVGYVVFSPILATISIAVPAALGVLAVVFSRRPADRVVPEQESDG